MFSEGHMCLEGCSYLTLAIPWRARLLTISCIRPFFFQYQRASTTAARNLALATALIVVGKICKLHKSLAKFM